MIKLKNLTGSFDDRIFKSEFAILLCSVKTSASSLKNEQIKKINFIKCNGFKKYSR